MAFYRFKESSKVAIKMSYMNLNCAPEGSENLVKKIFHKKILENFRLFPPVGASTFLHFKMILITWEIKWSILLWLACGR